MDHFVVSKEIANLFPHMQVVAVVARGLDNRGRNGDVSQLLTSARQDIRPCLSGLQSAELHPRVDLYRCTLKTVGGVSAKRYPQAIETMVRRLLKDPRPPRPINPVVDFCNAISMKYIVPIIALDLGDLEAITDDPLELRLTASGDKFLSMDAHDGEQAKGVEVREVAYAQGSTILSRHLSWRQSIVGLVKETTSDVILLCPVMELQESEEPSEMSKKLAEELQRGLLECFGTISFTSILGGRLAARETSI